MKRLLSTLVVMLAAITLVFAQPNSYPSGLTGASLRTWIKDNWYTGHHNNIGYNNVRRQMYSNYDERADGKVYCVYTGYSQNASNTTYLNPINAEHTVPQSFFGSAEPEKSDAHHLFPSHGSANTGRSNKKFVELTDDNTASNWYGITGSNTYSTSKPSSTDFPVYSKAISSGFEPREDHKGNVARAIFYFVTVYNSVGLAEVANSQTLWEWHQADPVDANEINRNNRIQASGQGNYNPYVSHPEWVGPAFGFSGGTGTPTSGDSVTSLNAHFDVCPQSGWTTFTNTDKDWYCDSYNGRTSTAATGFNASGPTTSWLISPKLDLSSASSTDLAFQTRCRYSDAGLTQAESFKVMVSANYSGTGDPSSASWTELSGYTLAPEGGGYIHSGPVSMASYTSSEIYLAFKFASSGNTGGNTYTWHVDSVMLNAGTSGGGGTPATAVTMVDEDFETSCPPAGWMIKNVASDKDWACDDHMGNNFMEMSGFGADVASDDWLITPQLDIDGMSAKYFSFVTMAQFGGPDLAVKYSTDYDGSSDPTTATWTDFSGFALSGANYDSTFSGYIDLSGISGTAYIAFHYTSTGTGSGDGKEWQVDDVKIGVDSTTSGGGGTPTPTIHVTEPFAGWTDNTSYAATPFTTDALTWEDQDVTRGANRPGSTGAGAQFNDDKTGVSLTSPSFNTVGTVSFYHSELNSGGGTFEIQTSVAGGAFTTVASGTYGGSGSWGFFTYDVNESNSDVKIRILSDDNPGHLLVDDIVITAYTTSGGGGTPATAVTMVDEDFQTTCPPAGWSTYSVLSDEDWGCNSFSGNDYMSISGFGADTMSNDWLITPLLDIDGMSAKYFSFVTMALFGGPDLAVKYSTDYDGSSDPTTATWTDFSGFALSVDNYDSTFSGYIDLSGISGTAYIAFHYTSTGTGSGDGKVWQVDDVKIGVDSTTSGGGGTPATFVSADFDNCPENGWTTFTTTDKDWTCDTYNGVTSMEATTFSASAPGDLYLISPQMDLSTSTSPVLAFNNRTRFSDAGIAHPNSLKVLVSTDYSGTGDPAVATWTELTGINYSPESSGDWVQSGVIDLSSFKQSSVYLTFKYTGSGTTSGNTTTWYVDSIRVSDGSTGGGGTPSAGDTLLNENFELACPPAGWYLHSLASAEDWECLTFGGNQYMQCSGWDGSASTVADDWLISPALDLSNNSYTLNFLTKRSSHAGPDLKVYYSTDYSGTGDPTAATWTEFTGYTLSPQPASGWGNFTPSGDIDLSSITGTSVYIAFQYTSTATESTTWQVDDVLVYAKSGGTPVIKDTVGIYTQQFDVCPANGWVTYSNSNRNWVCDNFGATTMAVGALGANMTANIWLISPVLDLDTVDTPMLLFKNRTLGIDNGITHPENLKVMVSTDYSGSGDPATATWTEVTGFNYSAASSGEWMVSGYESLNSFKANPMRVAFVYTSSGVTNTTAATWFVDSVVVSGLQVRTTPPPPLNVYASIDENFEASCPPADWIIQSVASNEDWECRNFSGNNEYMQCSGFGADEASDDWLITPAVDFTTMSSPVLSFTSIKGHSGPDITVKYSTNYDGVSSPTTATWTDLTGYVLSPGPTTGSFPSDSTFSGNVDLSMITDTGFIAFHYTSAGTGSGDGATWQIDNVKIDGVTGLDKNIDLGQVTIFPNPTTGSITVDLGELTFADVQLISLSGQVLANVAGDANVLSQKLSQTLANATNGVYLMRVVSEQNARVVRIVKQ